jgi:DNA-directed RNA polymerase subunit RPC12/RpoP
MDPLPPENVATHKHCSQCNATIPAETKSRRYEFTVCGLRCLFKQLRAETRHIRWLAWD